MPLIGKPDVGPCKYLG